jgi:hypothetical protein
MTTQTIGGPNNGAARKLSEPENAKPVVTTGKSGPWGKIGGLALALNSWLFGRPVSKRDRAMSAMVSAHNSWVNYW